MALQSVAIAAPHQWEHVLWLGQNSVLSFELNNESKGFPPSRDQQREINRMIQGLARAARSVVAHAEGSPNDTDFMVQPIEDIADSIMLLSQLSDAIGDEMKVGK